MGKDQVYRSKLKADPVRYANYLRKEVERCAKRKKAGNIKSISDMSERQQRIQRRRWRKAQKKSRQKNQQLASIPTPEASPTIFAGIGTPETSPIPSCSGTKKAVGRKMVRRDRSKAYRTIDKLNSRIETLEVELGRKKKEVKKIQKRNEHLTSKLTFKDTPRSKARRLIKEDGKGDKVKTALIKHFAVMSVIKQHRKSTKLEAQKKRQYKDILSKKVIWACRIRTQLRKDFRIYNRSAKARRTTDKRHRVASTIHKFLKRDDVSICQPGKKQCVTRHGVKKQKQVLIKSMMLSYEKFCGESVCEKVSYATFCRYRPFWIVAVSLGNRDTCACKRHENLQFMANKFLFNKVIATNNLTALAETLCCHKQNKNCSYRTCTGCMNNKIPQNVFTATDTVEYCSWEVANHEYTKDGITHTSKVTDKIQKKSTLGDLLDLFNEDLKSKLAHLFNIRHQYETLNTLKTVIGPDEAIIHIDFSENYQGKGFREIQSKHFGTSHRQISLHTGIIYTQMAHQCFCTFSDCTRHDPSAIWAHLDPILVNLDSSVKTVHFVSDGPTTQYRNKMNFYLASTRLFDYGIKMVTWNMLEAGHGKGAADGVGGSIKRAADRYVAAGADIENAHAMVTQLQSSHSSIKMYVIDKEAVEDIDKTLPPKSQVKTFPGTMKVHQLCSSVDHRGHAYFRDVSCFCKSPEVCMCYDNKPFKISDKGLQLNGDLRKCAGGNANGATVK